MPTKKNGIERTTNRTATNNAINDDNLRGNIEQNKDSTTKDKITYPIARRQQERI